MALPVGIQDVVMVVDITKKIVDRYNDAPEDRQQLVHLCKRIYAIVEPIKEGDLNDMLLREGNDYVDVILKDLQATLRELDQFLEANQLTSGLEGFFRRMDFALRTKGQRDRLKEELDVHLNILNAALSVSGLHADQLILQRFEIMERKQDAGDDAMNRMEQRIIEIHQLAENINNRYEANYESKGASETRGLQGPKDFQSLEPLISAYSSKTGIDREKLEKTMTALFPNYAVTSLAASANRDLNSKRAGKRPESESSPSQTVRFSYLPLPNAGMSSDSAPRLTVRDMEREEQTDLQERLRKSNEKSRELEKELADTQRQLTRAENRAIRAHNQHTIAEQHASEAQSRCTIAHQATIEAERQLGIAWRCQHIAERQRSTAMQRALDLEGQLERLKQESLDDGQRYAIPSPRSTVTQNIKIQVARLNVNQTIVGSRSCPSSPGPFHHRRLSDRPSSRQPALGLIPYRQQ